MIAAKHATDCWSDLMNNPEEDLVFRNWQARVDALLQSQYAVTLEDAGLSRIDLDAARQSTATPEQFVGWFGKKYELISKQEWATRFNL